MLKEERVIYPVTFSNLMNISFHSNALLQNDQYIITLWFFFALQTDMMVVDCEYDSSSKPSITVVRIV